MRSVAATALTVVVVIALAGCGLEDPYAGSTTADDRDTAATGAPTETAANGPERAESTATAHEQTTATPQAAARGVALAAGNWTTETVDKAFRDAVRLSIGGARAELRRQARQMQVGVKQASVEIRSETAVETVAVRGSGDTRRAVVVTREAVTGGEVTGEGTQYRVTLAELKRLDGGWVVSQWVPQS